MDVRDSPDFTVRANPWRPRVCSGAANAKEKIATKPVSKFLRFMVI
jgi:hypothetical protein